MSKCGIRLDMKRTLFVSLLLTLCLATAIFSQNQINSHRFKGVVKDKTLAVIAGLNLHFDSGNNKAKTSTDINGEFSVDLAPGNYKMTARACYEL